MDANSARKPITLPGILFVVAVFSAIVGLLFRFVGRWPIPYAIDLWPTLVWLVSWVHSVTIAVRKPGA